MVGGPIRRPELDELETFLLAAKLGSLTSAAGKLRLSKTAVAKRLRSLEALVGHRLLERGPRGVTLTEEGRRLVPQVEDLLREAETIFGSFGDLRRGEDASRISGIRALSGATALSTERVLAETEHVFAEIFHASSDAIALCGVDGSILEVNQAYARLAGRSRDDIVGRTAVELGVVSREALDAVHQEAAAAGGIATRMIDLRTSTGEVRHVEFSLRSLTLRARECYLVASRDVTELVRHQRGIVRQAAQQQAMADLTLSALSGEPRAKILTRASELLASHLDATFAAVWEASGDDVELRSVHGLPRGRLTAVMGTPKSRRPFLEAIDDDGEVSSDDLAHDRRFFRDGVRALGIRSLAAVKIGLQAGERYGFAAVGSIEPAAFSRSDKQFVQGVANVLALVVRSERLAEEEERKLVLLNNFTALAEASSDPTSLLTLDGHYVYLNHAARRFRAGDPSLDHESASVFDGLDARALHRLRRVVFPQTTRNGRWEGTFTVSRPSGLRWSGRLTTILVRDPLDASPTWIAAIFRGAASSAVAPSTPKRTRASGHARGARS